MPRNASRWEYVVGLMHQSVLELLHYSWTFLSISAGQWYSTSINKYQLPYSIFKIHVSDLSEEI